jgi:hypothetical protein
MTLRNAANLFNHIQMKEKTKEEERDFSSKHTVNL